MSLSFVLSEEIAALNLAKYRKVQAELGTCDGEIPAMSTCYSLF